MILYVSLPVACNLYYSFESILCKINGEVLLFRRLFRNLSYELFHLSALHADNISVYYEKVVIRTIVEDQQTCEGKCDV